MGFASLPGQPSMGSFFASFFSKKEALAASFLALLLLVPLTLVEVPPVLDYPNHLARIFLLAKGSQDPMLAPMFEIKWGIIPNLAVDLVGPALVRLMPVHVAGRVLLGVLLVAQFAGVLALNRAIFGQMRPWALASALVLPAGAFLLGFLNFVAGLAAALFLAAFWIATRRRRPVVTLVVSAAGLAAIFFLHLMGVVFALVLILGWEARSLRAVLTALPIAVPPTLLYLAAPLNDAAAAPTYLPIGAKLAQVLAPFVAYDAALDVQTALLVGGLLVGCALTRRLVVPPGSARALVALAVLYAVAPYAFKGTQSLDARFLPMLVLTLFAATDPRPRLAVAVGAGFALLLVVRTIVLATAWQDQALLLAQFRTAIAPVPPGALVFVAAGDRAPHLSNGIRTDTHLGALLLIERRAFFPLLFDDPTQQPLVLTPPYQRLADRNGGLVEAATLAPAALCGYDFVLLQAPDPEFARPYLTEVTTTKAARLFRVVPSALPCG